MPAHGWAMTAAWEPAARQRRLARAAAVVRSTLVGSVQTVQLRGVYCARNRDITGLAHDLLPLFGEHKAEELAQQGIQGLIRSLVAVEIEGAGEGILARKQLLQAG